MYPKEDDMHRLERTTIGLFVTCVMCNIVVNTVCAEELTKTPLKINGMLLVTLDGPYQYNSGGVPLYGYITAINVDIKPNDQIANSSYQATDKVQFHVCKTGKEISVNYGDLTHVKQGCGTSGRTWPETTASWPKWKVDYGKLVVVDQKASWVDVIKQGINVQNLTDIPISNLPVGYQSVLSSEKQGKTVAVTVPANDGSLLLGILPERKLNNGS
jgi:hypothetical protein